jgi:integrase
MRAIEQRGAAAASNRARAYLSKFFSWCLEHELLQVSPTVRVRPLSGIPSRDRVLSEEELAWIVQVLESFPGPFGPLFRILALTGQRRGEVAGMRWNELRGLGTRQAVWDLPGNRTKNGQPHLVPLAPAVQAILTAIPQTSTLVFSTNNASPVSGFSKAKRLLDREITNLRSAEGLPPLPQWTLHDLRRTMVTAMNEHLGIQPHVVEAVVNHTSGTAKRGVAGVYNRALYLAERRQALEMWAQSMQMLDRYGSAA